MLFERTQKLHIVALRNEKGSYNLILVGLNYNNIVALRNEKGSYNAKRTE